MLQMAKSGESDEENFGSIPTFLGIHPRPFPLLRLPLLSSYFAQLLRLSKGSCANHVHPRRTRLHWLPPFAIRLGCISPNHVSRLSLTAPAETRQLPYDPAPWQPIKSWPQWHLSKGSQLLQRMVEGVQAGDTHIQKDLLPFYMTWHIH